MCVWRCYFREHFFKVPFGKYKEWKGTGHAEETLSWRKLNMFGGRNGIEHSWSIGRREQAVPEASGAEEVGPDQGKDSDLEATD